MSNQQRRVPPTLSRRAWYAVISLAASSTTHSTAETAVTPSSPLSQTARNLCGNQPVRRVHALSRDVLVPSSAEEPRHAIEQARVDGVEDE